ncbi:syntaxin, Qa-SNARE family, putative [Plasmodium gallinaceum]|uniref:Syntaxin, Qa-SNARE family, putative n=1 Tax=Plasmodium gallinaceum TaxID=5849 RepID=A0A1J1GR50_PLAGA|nr:syntaxin, Qa-SNARE family, putative [Plasmodium gallinaceum]CRG94993.1 syntaxin, Qa-SNARE family, putative [Plasmodium gallinaceum]
MDRFDEFIHLCKKFDKNVDFVKREKKEKDFFLIKSSEIYTKLFSNCEYIDNKTLKKYGLFLKNKYIKEHKTKIKNKDHLIYSIKKISENIKFLKPQIEIHKHILNCLNNLLSIFIDIINKYEHNLNNYLFKLNKYTNFYFYDIQSIKFNFDYLNKLNNIIYSDFYNNQPNEFNIDSSFECSSFMKNKKHNDCGNNKRVNLKNEDNNDDEKTLLNNENYVNDKSTKLNEIYNGDNSNKNLRKRESNKIKFERKDNNDIYNKYNYIEEEEEKKNDWMHNNSVFHDDYPLNNNQKLEFKKYVDLFEKEENTYIMETKKKVAKISNLMNVFVNKIYEQNENLKMIENIIEESIENVSHGNIYLSKIQKKKNLNSLIFFVLICASFFLFIFDFFR